MKITLNYAQNFMRYNIHLQTDSDIPGIKNLKHEILSQLNYSFICKPLDIHLQTLFFMPSSSPSSSSSSSFKGCVQIDLQTIHVAF